ncbi:hypothetical protein FOZ63_028854 [Perkinsus olseni]|uniref:FAD dependent oxidoreductase domain-containing protein n=1 Tax=Perkinsus olseni TaxID=32597 RepID=A0A7J6SDP5_PEROL|nr:hypothetical protein FOZ63_028854 [Perkinsus olseni]
MMIKFGETTTPAVDLPVVEDPLSGSYEYVVIGAGLTGVATALHLGRAGHSVLVLEAGPRPAWRASGRNGGHVWPSSHAHEDEGGMKKLRFEMSGAKAVSEVEARKIRGSIELACSSEERDEQRALGDTPALEGVEILNGDEGWLAANLRSKRDGYGGIRQPNTATANPVRLAYMIAKKAADTKKVSFSFDTLVESISKDSSSLVLEGGRCLKVGEGVVLCTNAFTGVLLPELAHCFTQRLSHVIAVPCRKEDTRLAECTLAAVNDTVYISRPVPDRILIGGEGASELEAGAKRLERYLQEHSQGDVSKVEACSSWSELLCFTPDGLPLVGPVPGRRNLFVCAGFNGNGLPLFYECARAVALYATGRESQVDEWVQGWARPYRKTLVGPR